MTVMLENGVVPIVNENDTVSVTELMFTDNDELSGLIASMMDAETLVILSNVDGIYDGPLTLPQSQVIRQVKSGTDLSEYIQAGRSGVGRGGMITKCNIARKVADEGIRVIIANGKRDNILIDLVERPETTLHTEFEPLQENVSGIKKWIAHSDSFAKGVLRVNARACEALQGQRAVSLLLVGVTDVEGDFEEGDLVSIVDPQGTKIAVGRSAYDSATARELIGQHDQKPIIHYDYLYME
jgi:glutamate 5-kinase